MKLRKILIMKHGLAIGGALIGVGIRVLIDPGVASVCLGLSLGALLGYFVAGLIDAKKNLLKEAFAKLGNLRGRSLDEIVAVAGPYKSFQTCTLSDRGNAPGFMYAWTERDYFVALLFDADNICIGVSKEIDGQKTLH